MLGPHRQLMDSGDLERLLSNLREIADRRAATEPGTEERAELDEALRAVQDRILYWSADDLVDEAPSA
jgi:hypothetical protein